MLKDIETIKDLTGSDEFLVLYRVNFKGLRLYIEPEPFSYYSGLTGAMTASTFRGDIADKRIQKWREGIIEDSGKEGLNKYMDTVAQFGTSVHEALVTLKEKGSIDWAEESDRVEAVFKDQFITNGMMPDTAQIQRMIYAYQKQLASMMQFIHERVDEIFAIETPAISKSLKIATPIDLVCNMRNTPKAEFKKTTINIKSGKYITDHHLIQASCELIMWNETYGQIPGMFCQNTGILRTTEWRERTGPNFDYKYFNLEKALEEAEKISKRMKLCLEDPDSTYYPDPSYRTFIGKTTIGEVPTIKSISLKEDWMEHWEKSKQ